MAVIVLAGNKGGTGKSTLAINLAAALARRSRTVILDADPQGSVIQWSKIRAGSLPLSVVASTQDTREYIVELKHEYDHVVVDCPPSILASQLADSLAEATSVLIPVQPSPVDLWSTVHIESLLARAYGNEQEQCALLVINQLEPRTVLSQIVCGAVNEFKISVAKTTIRRRAVYRNSILEGRTVFEMGKRGHAAVEEIQELVQEVLRP